MDESLSPRAARLIEEARAAREALQNQAAPRAKSDAPRRAAKAGAASRDLNRRIRGVLREHIDSVYGDAQNSDASAREYSPGENASDAATRSADGKVASREYSQGETISSQGARGFADKVTSAEKARRDVKPLRADGENANSENADGVGAGGEYSRETLQANETANAPAEKPAAGSWESLADEIAPSGARVSRGLATGTARRIKPAKGDASTRSQPLMWRPEPLSPRAILADSHAPNIALHTALGGLEKRDAGGESHYLVARAAAHYDAIFAKLGERMARVLASGAFSQLEGAAPQDLLFVDIETTGLSSALPLFLIGALEFSGAACEGTLHLFLARDYPEERSLLQAFHALAAGKSLVTFNGKSFDWPYIEGRSVSHRLQFQKPPAHFDMLHFARRQWKNQLPNCKLQTLELYLCGRNRVDDVAGGEIPRTYHEFVRTHAQSGGGAHLMGPILHHNALDILTMAELFCLAGEES